MRKAWLCSFCIGLVGCDAIGSPITSEMAQPTIQPIIVEVDQRIDSSFLFQDKTITITSDHPIDDPHQLIQWISDQTLLVDQWIKDALWFDQLNTLPLDTPNDLDQRLLTILELGQLVNQTIPSISPFVLSNTFFNAYDYIHIDPNASTLTLDTALDFVKSNSLYDGALANQLLLSQPWFDFDHIVISDPSSQLLINRNSSYVTIIINDPSADPCLSLNLTKSNWIKTITLSDERTIILISSEPLTIATIAPYLSTLSYDQINLILDTFHDHDHPLQAIWFDKQADFDITKLTHGNYQITWSDGLDQQLMPIIDTNDQIK